MITLNFSHPLRDEVNRAIENATKNTVETLLEIPVQFDHQQPFVDQIKSLLNSEKIGISAREWQTGDIFIVLPAHSLIALVLIAELDGRIGHLPAVTRLKPEPGSLPTRFTFAEIIDLHQLRERSRQNR